MMATNHIAYIESVTNANDQHTDELDTDRDVEQPVLLLGALSHG